MTDLWGSRAWDDHRRDIGGLEGTREAVRDPWRFAPGHAGLFLPTRARLNCIDRGGGVSVASR